MTARIKDGDVQPAQLLDTKTMEEVFSYRVRAGGKWCWPVENKALVYFTSKADRDAEMASVKARLAAERVDASREATP